MVRKYCNFYKEAIPLLEFKNITVVKGPNKKVLDSIDITIRVGENIAIIGPNGSGKSSLIKTITREYYPLVDEKSVYKIWGKELWNVFELRFLLGIVTGELQYACNQDITGEDVVLSGFFSSIGLFKHRVTKTMREKTKRILDFLEVGHLIHRSMLEMSTGEARRILIARALVHEPKALILDEPTNSLDLHALHKFRNLLHKIANSGTNIILVTHNLQDIIPDICRIIMIKEGGIFKDGLKQKVLTSANVSRLFGIHSQIKKISGYYYGVNVG